MRGQVKPEVTWHFVNLQGKHCKDVKRQSKQRFLLMEQLLQPNIDVQTDGGKPELKDHNNQ